MAKRLIDANAYAFPGDLINEPAVDAVEVVRCAQCEHFGHNAENDTYCSARNGLSDPEPDDFCSYGERKEE